MPAPKPPLALRLFTLLTLLTTLALASPLTPAASQAALQVETNQVEMNFPDGLYFRLSASAQATILSASLVYGLDSRTCQEVTSRQPVKFESGKSVDLEWEWEFMRSGGTIPPGARLWWQWELVTESGETLQTEPEWATISDQRHTWQSISGSGVTIQWYEGTKSFGQSLLSTANNSVARLERELGVRPEGEITFTIYPSAEEVVDAVAYTSEWAGGVAFLEYNSLIIGIAPGEDAWANEVIPHELAHLVVNVRVFNCEGVTLPTWLSEGLAVFSEGPTSAGSREIVLSALEGGTLPELVTLRNGFSAYGASANQSYAQSGMVVEWLADTYGSHKMSDFLDAFANGNEDDEALQLIYQMDTAGLDRAWRASLGYSLPTPTQAAPGSARPTRTPVPTLALWTAVVPATPLPASATPLEVAQATSIPPTPLPSPTATERIEMEPTLAPTPAETTGIALRSSTLVLICLGLVLMGVILLAAIFLVRRKKS